MGSNGHDPSADELKREADSHRKAMKRTASELQDRLREKKEQVEEVIDHAREKMSSVDDFITRHRYVMMGGALGIGIVLGVRRRGSNSVSGELPDGGRYVLVERRQSKSIFKSLLGGLVALGARQGVAWLSHKLEGGEDYEERPLLTQTRGIGERDRDDFRQR